MSVRQVYQVLKAAQLLTLRDLGVRSGVCRSITSQRTVSTGILREKDKETGRIGKRGDGA